MVRKIFIAIAIILILAIIAYYVYDITINGTPPTENLVKMIIPVIGLILSVAKVLTRSPQKRKPLVIYEERYKEELYGAFADSPKDRKKLLSAIRLYNENRINAALKAFYSLRTKCKNLNDAHSVGLFTAITLSDAGAVDSAIREYEALIRINAVSSTVYSNLGILYHQKGMEDEAIQAFESALQIDENNAPAYNNLANVYFDSLDFEKAKVYFGTALEINKKFRPAASNLAIIYLLEDNTQEAEKYIHIAVSKGASKESIFAAAERYRVKFKERASEDYKESSDSE